MFSASQLVFLIVAESGLPEASLLMGLIMVASPMSCIVSEVGAPVLARSPCSSDTNDRHSGPVSCSFSVITNPHRGQNVSPDSLSVTSFSPAHLGQTIAALIDIVVSRVMNFVLFMNQRDFCRGGVSCQTACIRSSAPDRIIVITE